MTTEGVRAALVLVGIAVAFLFIVVWWRGGKPPKERRGVALAGWLALGWAINSVEEIWYLGVFTETATSSPIDGSLAADLFKQGLLVVGLAHVHLVTRRVFGCAATLATVVALAAVAAWPEQLVRLGIALVHLSKAAGLS